MDIQPLPTRLVDVGSADGSGPVHLRLSKEDECGIYAALSYCWGASDLPFITTNESLHERISQIPISNLPATFLHAIQLCRRLGIQYVWIDALCIIQDDKNDWRIEADRMSSIYSRSAITFSATLSADVSQGFLNDRKVPEVWLPWHDFKDAKQGLLHLRQSSQGWYDLLGDGAPLMKRGWTMQERLLAPRVLHFGQQMFWECWTCMRSQDQNPDEMTEQLTRMAKFNQEGGKYRLSDAVRNRMARRPLPPIEQNFRIFTYWSRILADFTQRELTVSSDKLPALAGLARKVQQQTGDIYCAGLWRSCLPEFLLWSRQESKFLKKSPEYRAPSWSWASFDGKVERWRPEGYLPENMSKNSLIQVGHDDISILDVSVLYSPADSLGEVETGEITLRGSMTSLEILGPNVDFDPPDADFVEGMQNGYPIDALQTKDSPEANAWGCLFDCEPEADQNQFWALQVHTSLTFEVVEGSQTLLGMRHGALILREIENPHSKGEVSTYERLGRASLSINSKQIATRLGVAGGTRIDVDVPWEAHTKRWPCRIIKLI